MADCYSDDYLRFLMPLIRTEFQKEIDRLNEENDELKLELKRLRNDHDGLSYDVTVVITNIQDLQQSIRQLAGDPFA